MPFYGSNFVRDKIEIQNTHFTYFSYDSWFLGFNSNQMGANDACFMIENLIMHWIMESIKIHVQLFFLRPLFYVRHSSMIFYLFLVWFTPEPESKRRDNFFTIMAWIFGFYFWCIFMWFDSACHMLIFISFSTTRTSRWNGFLIATIDRDLKQRWELQRFERLTLIFSG